MSDDMDVDYGEIGGSDDVVEDYSFEDAAPQESLKVILKPRAAAVRARGTGRPRGRPRGSGSGLTLKVRRTKPEAPVDDVPAIPLAPPIEPGKYLLLILVLVFSPVLYSRWKGICESW